MAGLPALREQAAALSWIVRPSAACANVRGTTPICCCTPTKADWVRLSSLWRHELDDCIGCGCLSIEACKLRNPLDQLSEQGSGPQRL
jgi:hypothetical protein